MIDYIVVFIHFNHTVSKYFQQCRLIYTKFCSNAVNKDSLFIKVLGISFDLMICINLLWDLETVQPKRKVLFSWSWRDHLTTLAEWAEALSYWYIASLKLICYSCIRKMMLLQNILVSFDFFFWFSSTFLMSITDLSKKLTLWNKLMFIAFYNSKNFIAKVFWFITQSQPQIPDSFKDLLMRYLHTCFPSFVEKEVLICFLPLEVTFIKFLLSLKFRAFFTFCILFL